MPDLENIVAEFERQRDRVTAALDILRPKCETQASLPVKRKRKYHGRGRGWTSREHKLLRELYAQKSLAELSALFKRTPTSIKSRARVLGVRRGNRKDWTAAEDALLRRKYPDQPTGKLATLLIRSTPSIVARARLLGLKKSESYLASPDACRLRRGDNIGLQHRFPKGHVPANKGLRRPGYAPGRMAETQFRKGLRPNSWCPIGTVRPNADGYLKRKIDDQPHSIAGKGASTANWEFVHRRVWEDAHGPIPRGHRIWWKDGNHLNCALENLELLTGQEHMARTTVHNLPPELKDVIQLKGSIRRVITMRSKKNAQKQDVGPAQPPVRNPGSFEGRRETYGS